MSNWHQHYMEEMGWYSDIEELHSTTDLDLELNMSDELAEEETWMSEAEEVPQPTAEEVLAYIRSQRVRSEERGGGGSCGGGGCSSCKCGKR